MNANAHDRSSDAEYHLSLQGVPAVGQLLTIVSPDGKRLHFRIEDVQHPKAKCPDWLRLELEENAIEVLAYLASTGSAHVPSLQLNLRKAQEPIRHPGKTVPDTNQGG